MTRALLTAALLALVSASIHPATAQQSVQVIITTTGVTQTLSAYSAGATGFYPDIRVDAPGGTRFLVMSLRVRNLTSSVISVAYNTWTLQTSMTEPGKVHPSVAPPGLSNFASHWEPHCNTRAEVEPGWEHSCFTAFVVNLDISPKVTLFHTWKERRTSVAFTLTHAVR